MSTILHMLMIIIMLQSIQLGPGGGCQKSSKNCQRSLWTPQKYFEIYTAQVWPIYVETLVIDEGFSVGEK